MGRGVVTPERAVLLDRTVGRVAYRFHRWLYRVSGGRVGHRAFSWTMLLLTTTGRKSGEPRTTPLMTYPDGDRYIVVASNGGRDETPNWFLNLCANPLVNVQVGRRSWQARARVLTPDERAAIWPRLHAYYDGWSHYEQLTTRPIPAVELTRVN